MVSTATNLILKYQYLSGKIVEWRLFEVKQHKYKLVLEWVTIWRGWFILYDTYRHVTTTILIKSLTLEGTHSDYVSSGLEGLLAIKTLSIWDFSISNLVLQLRLWRFEVELRFLQTVSLEIYYFSKLFILACSAGSAMWNIYNPAMSAKLSWHWCWCWAWQYKCYLQKKVVCVSVHNIHNYIVKAVSERDTFISGFVRIAG